MIAIGKSTNLIGREANILIIRGGGEGASIYTQMLRAAEEYFPDSNITDDPDVDTEALGVRDEENNRRGSQLYPLRRVTTGATSLVGSMNGQRPGGFVLVIDGLALTDVSLFFCDSFPDLDWLTGGRFSRLLRTSNTGTCFFVWRRCAKV
jgi:phospholipid-translocating ATPase